MHAIVCLEGSVKRPVEILTLCTVDETLPNAHPCSTDIPFPQELSDDSERGAQWPIYIAVAPKREASTAPDWG